MNLKQTDLPQNLWVNLARAQGTVGASHGGFPRGNQLLRSRRTFPEDPLVADPTTRRGRGPQPGQEFPGNLRRALTMSTHGFWRGGKQTKDKNMRLKLTTIFVFACAVVNLAAVQAQAQSDAPVKVTPETFIRAETDARFAGTIQRPAA